MRRCVHLLCVFAALSALTAPCARAAPLRLCYEDVPQPPWTMPDGRGLNMELLRRVEVLTGEQFILARRPWTRCVEETRLGLMDGMIGAADWPKRRQFSMPPLLPDGNPDPAKAMHHSKINIFLRTDSPAAWDGKELTNPRGIVIIQRGYFVGDLMRARGQRVIDNVKSTDEALRLLVAGSADVAVLMEHSADALVRSDPRFRGRVTMAPLPFVAVPLYLMISKSSYQQDPARIEALWKAIASARANADYRKLEAAETRRVRLD